LSFMEAEGGAARSYKPCRPYISSHEVSNNRLRTSNGSSTLASVEPLVRRQMHDTPIQDSNGGRLYQSEIQNTNSKEQGIIRPNPASRLPPNAFHDSQRSEQYIKISTLANDFRNANNYEHRSVANLSNLHHIRGSTWYTEYDFPSTSFPRMFQSGPELSRPYCSYVYSEKDHASWYLRNSSNHYGVPSAALCSNLPAASYLSHSATPLAHEHAASYEPRIAAMYSSAASSRRSSTQHHPSVALGPYLQHTACSPECAPRVGTRCAVLLV
jgi:hypothetical protein